VDTAEVNIELDGGKVITADIGGADGVSAGTVVFAHGSGSSRLSARNRAVAGALRSGGFATVLADLLTSEEEAIDVRTREYRFDIGMLAERVERVVGWLRDRNQDPIGLFGASTGAAAALIAAANLPSDVSAVVSRGGRPDLAGDALRRVKAPTLLIVGGSDPAVLDLNRSAATQMTAPTSLEVVPGATHLFEEPGALERVTELALAWFSRNLVGKG
jgi:pimeloyl-ACP methyl ester carboxylesterase